MSPYVGVLVMLVAAAGFLVTMLLLAIYMGPKHRTKTKDLPFECGSESVGDARNHRFHVRFYLVCILFLVFDVEVVLIYPWAVVLQDLGWPAFSAMLIFFVPLVVGLVYEWSQGVLDWNN